MCMCILNQADGPATPALPNLLFIKTTINPSIKHKTINPQIYILDIQGRTQTRDFAATAYAFPVTSRSL
jgi:hypothetical protein